MDIELIYDHIPDQMSPTKHQALANCKRNSSGQDVGLLSIEAVPSRS